VPHGFTLEVTHAGPLVRGHLPAWGGGLLPDAAGKPREVAVPELKVLRVAVLTKSSRHLTTAFSDGGRSVVASSDRLAALVTEILGAGAVKGCSNGRAERGTFSKNLDLTGGRTLAS
jgi:hypothetical protein